MFEFKWQKEYSNVCQSCLRTLLILIFGPPLENFLCAPLVTYILIKANKSIKMFNITVFDELFHIKLRNTRPRMSKVSNFCG